MACLGRRRDAVVFSDTAIINGADCVMLLSLMTSCSATDVFNNLSAKFVT